MPDETNPWGAERVLALAPDPSSRTAARSLATPGAWRETGYEADPPSLWGLCKGSGANPYQTGVDLAEPAFRCSCPSRKFPCKHALALMLLWSAGSVPPGSPPDWIEQWHAARAERREKAESRAESTAGSLATNGATSTDDRTPSRASQRRVERVDAGVEELDRWLTDQVRQGLAGVSRAGYAHWDSMAARLVDAQAPALASAVRRLASVAGSPDRLLTELSLIRLVVAGYRRLGDLPEDLAATVRSRVGFPVGTGAVLSGPRLRDEWAVVGIADMIDERLSVRRCWLRGTATGRSALVLSFAAPGQSLPADLPLGMAVEANVCFYPGVLPLRALVAERHSPVAPLRQPPVGLGVAPALEAYAEAIALEPWLERWPMLLAGVTPVADGAGRWHLRDAAGDALPLDHATGPPWRLIAASGGAPATVAAEWHAGGLRPLAAWIDGRLARP